MLFIINLMLKIYLLIRLHVHGVPYCTPNAEGVRFSETSVNVDVLLTVHLSITLVINQLNAQNLVL